MPLHRLNLNAEMSTLSAGGLPPALPEPGPLAPAHARLDARPADRQPEDVVRIVDSYALWLSTSPIPKLFIDADPAGFLIGAQREFCRAWPNQQTVTVRGAHFLQGDAPEAVGEATARFVAKVLAGAGWSIAKAA